jgi:hypothetical protein
MTSRILVKSSPPGGNPQSVEHTYIIHLMSDQLQPALTSLYTCNHTSQFGTDNGLCNERFAKNNSLRRPPRRAKEPRISSKLAGPVPTYTYFKHSSTTNLWALKLMDVTIQRSWLKLLKMTDIPFPTFPSVWVVGTRTLSKMMYAVPATGE